jgi:glycosyltransferase involved in cell wall biosynthesis
VKILHFIDSLRIGGSESQTVEVAVRQAARGAGVTIGCLSLDGPLAQNLEARGVRSIEFPIGQSLLSLHSMRRILALAKYLRDQQFDVVHTHDLYSNLFAVPAAWLARVPRIFSSRRDLASWYWYTPRNRRILRWVQRLSDTVVANSQGVKDYLITQDGFRDDHVVVIRNGVDFARFQLSGDRPRTLPGVSPEHFVFAMVANMHVHTKGHLVLIEAVDLARRHRQDFRFVLVGEGELRREFDAAIAAKGLQEYFVFLGARSDIPQILACCDGGMLASHAEGFPNAVLEYLAAGKSIIATSVGGVPEIIDSGRNGLLVPPNDPAALADAIVRIVADRSLASRLGDQARRDAADRFGFERLLDKLDRLYATGRPEIVE